MSIEARAGFCKDGGTNSSFASKCHSPTKTSLNWKLSRHSTKSNCAPLWPMLECSRHAPTPTELQCLTCLPHLPTLFWLKPWVGRLPQVKHVVSKKTADLSAKQRLNCFGCMFHAHTHRHPYKSHLHTCTNGSLSAAHGAKMHG